MRLEKCAEEMDGAEYCAWQEGGAGRNWNIISKTEAGRPSWGEGEQVI